MPQLLLGLLLAVIVSGAAYRLRALSRSGALAAALLGAVVFGLGGLAWAALLLAFFFTSSVLSRLFKRRKSGLNEKFAKGSQRDARQVAANGGISGLFVLLHLLYPGAVWPWLGFAGSLAAANADTWATELGVLSRRLPRLITTGRSVEPGSSGGISWVGSAAALAGGLLIGLLAAVLWQYALPAVSINGAELLAVVSGVAAAGLGGSLIDSLLGATLQAIYTCPSCQKETESHPLHSCGTPTIYLRGLSWLDNDRVNLACTIFGGVVAAVFIF